MGRRWRHKDAESRVIRCSRCSRILISNTSRMVGLCQPCERIKRAKEIHCIRCGKLLRNATVARAVRLCTPCFKRFRKARRLRLARMREKMRHAASFPRKRTSVKLRERFRVDGRGKPIRVIEVQVPYWTVDSLELVKGDMLRVHVEDGKRIVFEPEHA